jgi:signal peptidase I
MFFLTPRHVKHGKQFVKDAHKLLAYKRDVWSAATVEEVEAHIKGLDEAVRTREEKRIEEAATKLDKAIGQHISTPSDAWLRENVEVFMVAIVVALGVRTYFLQPFTIPTGSMQPTLNGIVFHETNQSAPNPIVKFVQGAIFGRHYVDFVAKEREQLVSAKEIKSPLPFISRVPGVGGFFTRTELTTQSESGKVRTYVIKEAFDPTVKTQFFERNRGRIYEPGEAIIRGHFDAGDHVFVDKVSYHFRKPKRGETFVFTTNEIPLLPSNPSTFYIKRLAGVPGDEMQIRAPFLFINGEKAQEPGFVRVMSGTPASPNNGYMGYGNHFEQSRWDQPASPFRKPIHLGSPDDPFKIPPKEYFALGDNSYNSYDSRGWGTVPEKNIMGRALIVYWPFLPHFGLTR